MNGYIDEDVAYFLGLIIGRGEIFQRDDKLSINISFPFKSSIDGMDQFPYFVTSITSNVLPRVYELIGRSFVNLFVNHKNKDVSILIELPVTNIIAKNLLLLLNYEISYSNYKIPKLILEQGNYEIAREFMRGFGDVSANIRRSNRDQNNCHRVYIDVLFRNWNLPVQVCYLLQEILKVPVDSIIWGHPNLRGNDVLGREHQIKIYAHEYVSIGFYIDHKQRILEKLVKENKTNQRCPHGKYCEGHTRRYRRKPVSPLEKDESLPSIIRGKHFNAYWEICAEFGCEKAKKYIADNRVIEE